MLTVSRARWAALVLGMLLTARAGAGEKSTPPKGVRVFSAGHSFHVFLPPILKDIAGLAKISDHEQLGLSAIGGSRVIQHWDVAEAKNQAKSTLKSGRVDVLTLSPIHLPDPGIENFVKLGFRNNPKIRVYVQEFWLPFDIYDTTFKIRPKSVDHDAIKVEDLRKAHEPYFKAMDAHVRELNEKFGKEVVFVTPVGQAVLALREKVVAGKVPGISKQSELFTDAIGHAKPAVMVLNAYCHFSVIYKRSPVGLGLPKALGKAAEAERLNALLQEISWDAVTSHPQSGVKKSAASR